jgi:hypothetical protein
MKFAVVLMCALVVNGTAYADPVSDAYLRQLSLLEQDLIPLVEAVPTERYGFRPTGGVFYDERTFGEQIKHVATTMYMAAAIVLGEQSPYGPGPDDNGPGAVQTKENTVDYLKSAFEYARRAMKSLNEKNLFDPVTTSRGTERRIDVAAVIMSHSYSHYGEMVVYARMNSIVPPSPGR